MRTKSPEPPTDEALTWPVLEDLPTLVWATDCELRFTSFLGAGLTALGVRPEQVVGRSLAEFFQSDAPDFPTIAAHQRAIQGESVSCEQDWAGHRFQVRVDPSLDGAGRIVGCIGLAQDVTEQQKHQRALRRVQEGLERQVAERTSRLARANERLRHEIKERRQAEEQLLKEQRYLQYVLELQDRDRQMVSYEIHDGLVQQLAAAIMQLEVFSRAAQRCDNAVWSSFETGLQRLNESMREARQLINGLRSPILDELGVVAAVEELVSQDGAQDEPQVDFVHHLVCQRLAPSLENAIYRIVQESLTNARRYSRSEQVLVRLSQRDDYIRIEVRDWGIGFEPKKVGAGHFGLEGIQERARLFGGAATVKSSLGKGTRIVVQLPLVGATGRVPARQLAPGRRVCR
jgi:PAS domain S-box-containing protein